MDKKMYFSVVIEMPQDPEKKNKLFREFGIDKTFHGGKIIAAMIGDAISDSKCTPPEK